MILDQLNETAQSLRRLTNSPIFDSPINVTVELPEDKFLYFVKQLSTEIMGQNYVIQIMDGENPLNMVDARFTKVMTPMNVQFHFKVKE